MKKIIPPWRNHEAYNRFGCCPENPIGLHMEFYEDGGVRNPPRLGTHKCSVYIQE